MRPCLQNNQTNKHKEGKQTDRQAGGLRSRSVGREKQLRPRCLLALSLNHADLAHSLDDAPSHVRLAFSDLQHLLLDTHPIGCLPSGPGQVGAWIWVSRVFLKMMQLG